jgi:GNAT superfamily N-acetyltransferase
MNTDITILRAEPHHAPRLTEITLAAKGHWGYPERWMQLWTPMLTITPQYISEHETWMAVTNEEPVAYYSLRPDHEGLWLDHLWVLPAAMGKGIGSAIFMHALERGRVLGASCLKIEADPHAAPFYEKMGARIVGEHHGEVDGESRILPVMEMRLPK